MKIVTICLFILLSRVIYFIAIQGTHSGQYFMMCNNLKDITQYIGICMLLGGIRNMTEKAKTIVLYCKYYCISFSIIMWYPILPINIIKEYINIALWSYNILWIVLFSALFLYGMFYRSENKQTL